MKTFKDNAGRDWTVAVNVATVKRLRDLLDVDLMKVVEGDLIERLYSDPVLLVDVLYVLCKPQADAAGIASEQFGEAMGGDAIELATAALIDGIIDFFPNRRDRERFGKVMEKFGAMLEKVHDALDVRVEGPALDRQLEQIVGSVGEPSGSSPESPASTPDP